MSVECTRLPSGLTVVTETMPHLESVALGTWIKSGARDEMEGEHGIAHLLEHMAFKGTRKRGARQIAEEIENVGGEVNAATSTETTSYYARVLKDHVPLAVDIPHRPVRCQLGFADLDGQAAALCQQRKQFLIQSADLIA